MEGKLLLAQQILGTAKEQGEQLPVNMEPFSVQVEKRCLGAGGTEGSREVLYWVPGEARCNIRKMFPL